MVVELKPLAVVGAFAKGRVVATLHRAIVIGNGIKLIGFGRTCPRLRTCNVGIHLQVLQREAQEVLLFHIGTRIAGVRIESAVKSEK